MRYGTIWSGEMRLGAVGYSRIRCGAARLDKAVDRSVNSPTGYRAIMAWFDGVKSGLVGSGEVWQDWVWRGEVR